MQLPDPRCYGTGAPDAEYSACAKAAAGDADARADCMARLQRALEAGNDAAIAGVLRRAASPAGYRLAWDLVCSAAENPAGQAPGAVVTRVFAIPVVFVAAAREPLVVPGALPDIDGVRTLLERNGVLGATRNFGLSNALCPLEALESLPASTVFRWCSGAPAAGPRDLEAREIKVTRRPEQVHLRFLVGAGISAAEAPSFGETAGTIGAWGMPLGRELGRQLARPDFDLLAIPRPPAPLMRAAHAGRRAQLELAFHLFASNTVRAFRSATGDPAVVLSSHRLDAGGAEVRVSLSSMLDEGALDGFRWPLHPLDDLRDIEQTIVGFFKECRTGGVRVMEDVLPNALDDGGAFIAVRCADALARRIVPN